MTRVYPGLCSKDYWLVSRSPTSVAGSLQQYVSDSYLYRAQLFEGRLALTCTYMLKSLFLVLQKAFFLITFSILSRVRIKLLFTLSYLLRILRSSRVILTQLWTSGPRVRLLKGKKGILDWACNCSLSHLYMSLVEINKGPPSDYFRVRRECTGDPRHALLNKKPFGMKQCIIDVLGGLC